MEERDGLLLEAAGAEIMNEPTEETLLEAAVQMALRRHAGRVPPEHLEAIRANLRLVLATHPDAQDILRRLRPRPAVQESGDVGQDELEALRAKAKGDKR